MQIRYYKEYSRFLNRFMEFKVYGHAGRPIVIFLFFIFFGIMDANI